MMMRDSCGRTVRLVVLSLGSWAIASAQAPTVDTFKQVLNQTLQKLRPDGYTERQVLFQEARAGAPNGGEYPFQVTLLIRDYGPGYPTNRFYGATCVGRMEKKPFYLSKNEFGDWVANGAMTVTLGPDLVCKNNPSAGVSSIPLESLPGTAAPAPASSATGGASAISTGEWACYGSGGSLLIGLGFRAEANGQYTDLDRRSRGSYSIQGSTITFKGGHLDGQTGSKFAGNRFALKTVSCEKYH